MRKSFIIFASCLVFCAAGVADAADKQFTDSFDVEKTDLSSIGANRYFVLVPGFQLVLEDKDKTTMLVITVLNETRMIDGVETRIIEENETENGQPAEISRNYFAISKKTGDVFYFGEEVDMYEQGKVVNHNGAWLSGVNGARFGLMMPATPLLGARHYQEIAPDVALDRAEVISLTETAVTAAGKLEKCLKTEETTPLEKNAGYKLYAPGIGLIQDGKLELTRFGQTQPSKE